MVKGEVKRKKTVIQYFSFLNVYAVFTSGVIRAPR